QELNQTKSYSSWYTALTQFSVLSKPLISGLISQVATSRDGHKIRDSPSKVTSLPPEKKEVTCGYFSVSAIRICFLLWFSNTSPNVLVRFSLSYTTFIP